MATSIRLPVELEQRLDRLAAQTGRTKAFYLRRAIEEYLGEMEDIYLAEKELKAVREGRARTYSLDEIKRETGLDD
jgi:RHH-type rel operon transcriptional repressor/antitoxin RelB